MKHAGLLFRVAIFLFFIKLLAAYTLNVDNIHKGEYKYQYQTEEIYEEHEGKLDENDAPIINGSFSFFVDNTQYIVEYYADKTGYHPIVKISDPNANDTQVGIPPRAVGSLLGSG